MINIKFADYPRVESLRLDDIMLIDGVRGTKSIPVKNAIATITGEEPTEPILNPEELTQEELITELNELSVLVQDGLKKTKLIPLINNWLSDQLIKSLNETGDLNNSIFSSDLMYRFVEILARTNNLIRRSIFRGKRLGGVPTDEQMTSILSGNYSDMFIGDYWGELSNVDAPVIVVADFSYYMNYRDSDDKSISTPHIVLLSYIPTDSTFSKMDQMDDNGHPTKFYPDTGLAERLKNEYIPTYLDPLLKSGLGEIMASTTIPYLSVSKRLPHMQLYDEGITEEYTSPVWSPSHSQIFGYPPPGATPMGNRCSEESQLALFKFCPYGSYYFNIDNYWLRDNRIVDSSVDGLDFKGNIECGKINASSVTFDIERGSSARIVALTAIGIGSI